MVAQANLLHNLCSHAPNDRSVARWHSTWPILFLPASAEAEQQASVTGTS